MAKVLLLGVKSAWTKGLEKSLAPHDTLDVLVAEALDQAPTEVDTLIYIAAGRGHGAHPWEVPSVAHFRQTVAASSSIQIRQWIILSSSAYFEPNPQHPGLVAESFMPSIRTGNTIPQQWQVFEKAVEEALADSEAVVTILRAAPTLMAAGNDFFSRLVSARTGFSLPGYDPSVQVLSPSDLAQAIALAIDKPQSGVFHVSPKGVIPVRQLLKLAGVRRLPLPKLLQPLLRGLLGAPRASFDQLDYVRYPSTISSREDWRFTARKTSAEAIAEMRSAIGRPVSVDASQLEFDEYGIDHDYVERYSRTFFKFLHDVYWRIEVKDLHNVPKSGRAVLAGVHRGHQPWDGVMAFYYLKRELDRYMRFLIHPALTKAPFLANYMTKLGGMIACQENADYVLEREGLLGIFPEGIQGAFSYYRDAYRLRRFGRNDFVKIALRHQAPIIPFVTVGSAEIFPIYGKIDWGWWKRNSGWPCLPITPTMSLLPLPSKWHTWYLEPIPVEHPPEAANDRKIVKAISQEVRHRMEVAIAEILKRRKSKYWGSVFKQMPA